MDDSAGLASCQALSIDYWRERWGPKKLIAMKITLIILGHQLRDLALLGSQALLRDAQPYTHGTKADDQAEEPAAKSNAHDGEDGEGVTLGVRQRVAVQAIVALERGNVKARGAGGGVGEASRNRPVEVVVGNVEVLQLLQGGQSGGQLAGEVVVLQVELVEVGAVSDLCGNGAVDLVVAHIQGHEV